VQICFKRNPIHICKVSPAISVPFVEVFLAEYSSQVRRKDHLHSRWMEMTRCNYDEYYEYENMVMMQQSVKMLMMMTMMMMEMIEMIMKILLSYQTKRPYQHRMSVDERDRMDERSEQTRKLMAAPKDQLRRVGV